MPPLSVQQAFVLALQHHQAGRLAEAEALYRQILAVQPAHPEAQHHLGVIAHQVGRRDLAIALIGRSLAIHPNNATACHNLGVACLAAGRLDEAAASYRQALELEPDHPERHNDLSIILSNLGRPREAIDSYRRALELKPDDAAIHSNLLYTLQFQPGLDDRTIAGEQQRWDRRFAEPLRHFHQAHANDRNPERRLRIGYVSPHFRRSTLCHFLLPLFEARDETAIEIYCYSSVQRPDNFTERLRKNADVWRDVLSLSDHDLAGQIRADQIDILVELTLHQANNRLLALARKPAPVQVSWLGYPASTGLSAIDYRFTDRFLEPEGSVWSDSVETPIRLPDSWFCFDPIEYPDVSASPAERAGHVTFGSLNTFNKVNETVLRLWSRLLQTVENSRLLLHCPAGETQTRLRQWFATQNIAPQRLDLVPRTSTRAEYLDLYQRIDIGLDSFPYNGGTTTCEALWMGVPVVSLAGSTSVSRMGLSVLTNAGLPELAAFSEDEYIDIAGRLARDLPRLAELRRTLRPRMQVSPLMDAPRFARNIETAYRAMWRRWCDTPSAP